MKRRTLKNLVQGFSRAKVLVVGDLILDEYIWGDVDRISPEAPVPVVWAKKRTFVPGGAANVASNLRSLGADVTVAGVIGGDQNGLLLLSELRKRGIRTGGIVTEKQRHTTQKSRIIARSQQVLRLDWERVDAITRTAQQKLADFFRRALKACDAVVIEDYGKGLFSNGEFLSDILRKAREQGRIITVDPKEENFESYWGVTAITPNRKETENAVRYLKIRDRENSFKVYTGNLETQQHLREAGEALRKHLNLECLLVTLGEQGMWLFARDGQDHMIPTVAREVFDVSGAGDTVIATFTLALAGGAPVLDAAHLANYAAGIVVAKVGTATVARAELIERLESDEEP